MDQTRRCCKSNEQEIACSAISCLLLACFSQWVYDNTTGEFRYKENQDLCLDAGTTIVPCSHPATQSMPFWLAVNTYTLTNLTTHLSLGSACCLRRKCRKKYLLGHSIPQWMQHTEKRSKCTHYILYMGNCVCCMWCVVCCCGCVTVLVSSSS